MRIDEDARAVIVGNEERHLPPMQWQILGILRRREGALITYEAMIDALWGDDPDGGPDDATGRLRVHICNLRKALAGGDRRIVTLWKTGVRLVPSV